MSLSTPIGDPQPLSYPFGFPGIDVRDSPLMSDMERLQFLGIAPQLGLEELPVNAVACYRRSDAELLLRTMGVDPSRWDALAFGDSLRGLRFGAAVVLGQGGRFSRSESDWFAELRCRSASVIFL